MLNLLLIIVVYDQLLVDDEESMEQYNFVKLMALILTNLAFGS